MRCFVALDLAADVLAALAAKQRALAAEAPRADVRWVDPAALHLTLKFLGEVREEDAARVVEAVGREAAAHETLSLALAGMGGFPSLRRARVLWAGIREGLGPLGRLAAGIERSVASLGFPPEAHPFRGHVTLARVRSPRGFGPLAAAVEREAETAFGAWRADEVVFYRSHRRPAGAVYEALAHLRLRNS